MGYKAISRLIGLGRGSLLKAFYFLCTPAELESLEELGTEIVHSSCRRTRRRQVIVETAQLPIGLSTSTSQPFATAYLDAPPFHQTAVEQLAVL